MTSESHSATESWFALRVKSRSETQVANIIRNKGFEEFVPLYESRRRWSDRVKVSRLPLFPGYVFCRLDIQRRLPLLTIPGVLHFVTIGRAPAVIDEQEIAGIQAAVQSGLAAEPWPYVGVGERVRLEEGPLAGVTGICVAHAKQQRLVISVTLLQRSVAITIDREWARPIGAGDADHFPAGFSSAELPQRA